MASFTKWLRDFELDAERIKTVNENLLEKETFAALSSEKICERFFNLVESGEKLPNPNSSILGYCLGITDEKPINQPPITKDADLPDIDIDFSDKQRDHVFLHMQEQYRSTRVARLGTVGFFKQRSALKQVGAILKIPIGMIEKAIAASDDVLSLKETFDTTDAGKKLIGAYPNARIAERLEDHPNVASQHAAGMLVTDQPIINYVAVDQNTSSAMLDKKDAEVLNLLKIDALGLTQLSIFERTLELLGHGIKTSNGIIVPTGFFEKLPLDDQKAFDVLNEGKFSGIFQFAGRALQGLTKEVTVDNLEDIVSITALARPGPMGSGGAGDWVKRRSGREEVTYIHPLMEELTKDTYGVLIYQEQVMHIVRKIGGLSWGDTSDIRRAIGKSMGAEALEKYYEMFKEGAIKNGVEEYIARKIWNDIVTFGRYGFNRSHAYAYACVSYYCCWLKAYHPIEFCAATLDAEPDVLKQRQLLIEMEKEDVGYIPMDPKLSTANWEVTERDGKDMLLGPLTTIRGLGPKVVQEVLAARNSNLPVRETIQKKLEKAKTEIDTLYPVRDSARKHYRKIKMTDLDTLFIKENHKNIEDIKAGHAGIVCCIGILTRAAIKDENAPEVVERRRGKEVYTEKTNSLAMFFQDDTGDIFCKIDRFGFEGMGKDILENGKIGKSIYVVFGTVPRSFRMISVSSMKYLGELED